MLITYFDKSSSQLNVLSCITYLMKNILHFHAITLTPKNVYIRICVAHTVAKCTEVHYAIHFEIIVNTLDIIFV